MGSLTNRNGNQVNFNNLNSVNLVFTERIEYSRFAHKSMKKYQDIPKVFRCKDEVLYQI